MKQEIDLQAQRERIGARIKELREEQQLTQQQLADLTGLLRQNIARIEKGRYSVGEDILHKIGQALGKVLDYI